MNEITTAILIFAISIITVLTAVFRGKAVYNILTYRFVKIIGGKESLTQEDLENHYIFVKFSSIDLVRMGQMYALFQNKEKYEIFEAYVKCIISVMEESLKNILKIELLDSSEYDLRRLLINESKWREAEYNKRFREYLSIKIKSTSDIDVILRKIELWRRKELIATTDSSLEVLSYDKGGSQITKIYTIFHQYALCLEIMVHSGAESFNIMNGELDTALNNKNKLK